MSVEEARNLVLEPLSALPAEEVAILESFNRVLAKDVASDIDVAPFDNSAMDGFAVRAADLAGATMEAPRSLEVVAHVAAGDDVAGIEIGPGQAARIMTGAPVPAGADSVVMVECTQVLADGTNSDTSGGIGSVVAFEIEPKLGEHIRHRGEEVMAGDTVMRAGEVLGPAGIGLLAATGHSAVVVHRRPRVAIISTGSELVEIAEKPGPGKIRNSNSYSLAAQVVAVGGIPLRFPIVIDDPDAIREAFLRAAKESDFIVTSGGVSVGDFDYVRPVLEELGELTFCKVMMRPGNPQTFGSIRGVPFFGLPGNPTSTYVGFEMFVRPALRAMQGFSAAEQRPRTWARLAHDVKKKPDRRYYLRGVVERTESGYEASVPCSQSSALLTAAHKGNCFVVLPEGERMFTTGTLVECVRLDMEEGVS